MKQRSDFEKRIEETLESLDGIQRAEPKPYFYTRVIGRLQRDERTTWSAIGSFLAKPAVAVAGLGLILVMNMFIVFRQDNKGTSSGPAMSETSELTFDNDYIIASSSSFDYENIDQQ